MIITGLNEYIPDWLSFTDCGKRVRNIYSYDIFLTTERKKVFFLIFQEAIIIMIILVRIIRRNEKKSIFNSGSNTF